MAKRNKSKRPERKILPKLHIFCEGEKTEPNYLRHYLSLCGGNDTPRDSVVIIEKRKKSTPVQLVEEARGKKESYPPCDKVWVVHDRESPTKYDDSLYHQVQQKAEAKGIRVALSNVCFEVWLLLHFQSNCAVYTSCSDLLNKSTLKKTHIPKYEKNFDCSTITFTQIFQARLRAKQLNSATKNGADRQWRYPYQWNPYSDVYKVLDEIDIFTRKADVISQLTRNVEKILQFIQGKKTTAIVKRINPVIRKVTELEQFYKEVDEILHAIEKEINEIPKR